MALHAQITSEPLGLFFDIWNFGSILKSPNLENAVIRALSAVVSKFNAKEDVSNQRELEFASSGMIEDKLDAAWERADFSPNHDMDLDRTKGEVFWGSKKILLSIFDATAWLGMDSTGVANIIRAGGEQAVILPTREMLVASGEVHGPPWAAENIEKYFSDEMTMDTEDESNRS
ncbi:hypothetical protein WAI453_009256 [Rhynchosporium graminicola]